MGWGRGGRHKREVKDFSGGANGKEPACQCRRSKRCGFDSYVGKIPWKRAWQPTPVFLPGESHGRKSLVGCSPRGRKESDTTERLHFHFSLSCIGEGNGSPLQCSCLENPRDEGAWWAAISGRAGSGMPEATQQQCLSVHRGFAFTLLASLDGC